MDERVDLETAVLAVDGGGSRCRVALGLDGRAEVVLGGPANVTTDFDGAIASVIAGIEALADRIGCASEVLCALPAHVGLAGVTDAGMANRVAHALPFRRATVSDDRPAAVRAALGTRDGYLAHCGTGSFYAVQTGGAIRLAGGWGLVLGDEASAGWVGRALLSGALEATDGRKKGSPLGTTLLDRFGGPGGIVAFAAAARAPEFGALAPMATGLAAEGDALALDVMERGAREIERGLTALGWQPGSVLCLTGGIGPEYGPYLGPEFQAALVGPIGEPLEGALSLARDLRAAGN